MGSNAVSLEIPGGGGGEAGYFKHEESQGWCFRIQVRRSIHWRPGFLLEQLPGLAEESPTKAPTHFKMEQNRGRLDCALFPALS